MYWYFQCIRETTLWTRPAAMKQTDLQYEAKTSFFRTLWAKPNKTTSADLIHLFSDCIQTASSRTKEYLLFRDPENKFHPSPSTLSEIFLMTYIQHSSCWSSPTRSTARPWPQNRGYCWVPTGSGPWWISRARTPESRSWSRCFICQKEQRRTTRSCP